MSDSKAPPIVDLRDLRLDTAHALVTHNTGMEAVLDRRAPAHYLQALIDGLCELRGVVGIDVVVLHRRQSVLSVQAAGRATQDQRYQQSSPVHDVVSRIGE